ncbi:MAG: OB-fold nucleic acid binding domain-containing protein [Candidatus Woesearchaeota archaeon]
MKKANGEKMYKLPLSTIKEKIKETTGLTEKEINSKIKDKMDLLSGLISEEGAAHILATELGVKLFEDEGKIKIKNILPGIKNIEVEAKIIKIYEIKEFDKNNKKGKIGSFLIGDETGIIRVVAWNDKADLLKNISEGQSIKIENAYSRENNGKAELHLGDKAEISFIENEIEVKKRENIRKKINELKEGDENIELLGIIVNVFDPKYFEICPECGKRAKSNGSDFICEQHGTINPSYSYVLNLILDDNTDTIRVVLWKNQLQNLLKMTDQQILDSRGNFEEIKTDLIGKFIKLVGRVNKNNMYERLEFVPNLVFIDPNPEEEIEKIKSATNEEKNKEKDNQKTKEDINKNKLNQETEENKEIKNKRKEKNTEEELNDLLEEIKDIDELDL